MKKIVSLVLIISILLSSFAFADAVVYSPTDRVLEIAVWIGLLFGILLLIAIPIITVVVIVILVNKKNKRQ